jgi:hypothetical protein
MAQSNDRRSRMKTISHEQFLDICMEVLRKADAGKYDDEGLDSVIKVVSETVTQTLVATGCDLPWLKMRRN